jgi:hypothetical protein
MKYKLLTPYLRGYNNLNKIANTQINETDNQSNISPSYIDLKILMLKNSSYLKDLADNLVKTNNISKRDMFEFYIYVIIKYYGYYHIIVDGMMVIDEDLFIAVREITREVFFYLFSNCK